MGHVDVQGVRHVLDDGRILLDEVSFRIGDGALGGLGVMRQFIGHARAESTVRDLLVSLAPPRLREAAQALDRAEDRMIERDDDSAQMAYAQAIADYTDAGGYEAEVLWDRCCSATLGIGYLRCRHRDLRGLSGGEQKRLALEALLRGPDEVLLLDEPDNYLDVPGKEWLAERIRHSPKTVLFVSHDRELLHAVAERIVTIEASAAGNRVWVHGGSFADYDQARTDRLSRLEELRRRWDEDRAKLVRLVNDLKQKAAYNDGMSSRLQAARTRLRRFDEAGPPEALPRRQRIRMHLAGGRTGRRAVVCENLALDGLTKPFDAEFRYGERIAVLGANGTGKTHFLTLLAGAEVRHSGTVRLGARVVPGLFAQTHEHPEFHGRTLLGVLAEGGPRRAGIPREEAGRALARYELAQDAHRPFDTLSGGQQARFQILLLELEGATLLLLDEPTDNLDLVSAEALQAGLEEFAGTVVAVTHDRWFARALDRYVVFHTDGRVSETAEPIWREE
jgi:ATPase subunit of ABC transporter with duplicated ATPase domains